MYLCLFVSWFSLFGFCFALSLSIVALSSFSFSSYCLFENRCTRLSNFDGWNGQKHRNMMDQRKNVDCKVVDGK